MQNQVDAWQRLSKSYKHYGPPLRPSAQDLEIYWDIIHPWIHGHGAPRVLLLGVTPELYHLPWPEGTDFKAVDRSQAMIDAVWPGPKSCAECADWLSLNPADSARDIILCDGGLHFIDYPEGQHRLVRALYEILSQDGLCIFRLYALPSRRESAGGVIQDLLDGKIGTPEALKIRLSMALCSHPEEGVEADQVYRALLKAVPDLAEFASKIGWSVEQMQAIQDYKDSKCKFYWLGVDRTIALFCDDPGGFRVHRIMTPSYELGSRCPTIAFQRLSISNVELDS